MVPFATTLPPLLVPADRPDTGVKTLETVSGPVKVMSADIVLASDSAAIAAWDEIPAMIIAATADALMFKNFISLSFFVLD
jgi:hypothetical protein